MKQKTIVALATAPGVAGISVIRISGEFAFEICDKVFVGKRKIIDANSHTILYGKIVSEDVILDSVTISVFKAPHSYTGENVIELGTHGGYIVANQIIELLLKCGASPAEPGEFTKRAFLNGKMDLTQVEAVADLIHSVSVPGAQTSARQLDGKFTLKLKSIREELVKVAGLLELELDFSEEDIELIPKSHIKVQIDKIVYALSELLADYKSSQILRTGYNIALTGKPNAGKSTLFNFLVKKNRAIVSDIAGTTRDYIEELIHLNGLAFRVTDTAGLRETTDLIEIEGIKMVEEVLQKANLILLLHSIDEQSSYLSLKEKFESLYPQAMIIVVFTKADLQDKEFATDEEHIYISAKRAEDIKLLLDKFYLLASQSIDNMRDALINDRQKALIEQAIDYLQTSISSLEAGMTNEVIAYDIRNSSKALGEITGDSWNEEVLAAIFSQFCIGK